MEPKVIEEIAEQLGMAVGEASKFIEGILPQYAKMCVVNNVIVLSLVIVPLLVLCIIGVVKSLKKLKADPYEDIWTFCAGICFIAGIVILLITVMALQRTIGWALFPEAMLLDMAIEAVA